MKFIALFIISFGAWASPNDLKLQEFFKNKTKITNPFELRDPFKAPNPKAENKENKAGYFSSGTGQYSNLKEQQIPGLHEMKIVGVLIGKERRAMASTGKGSVIVLKEGMKIGQDGAELKAILPGGIVIVEKIINVYGQEEYLETVIPISK